MSRNKPKPIRPGTTGSARVSGSMTREPATVINTTSTRHLQPAFQLLKPRLKQVARVAQGPFESCGVPQVWENCTSFPWCPCDSLPEFRRGRPALPRAIKESR